jgi:hypothetical protein
MIPVKVDRIIKRKNKKKKKKNERKKKEREDWCLLFFSLSLCECHV